MLALITFALLFWIGWDQSYRDHLVNVLSGFAPGAAKELAATAEVKTKELRTPPPPPVLAAPQSDNNWMWRRSKLDNPHQKSPYDARQP